MGGPIGTARGETSDALGTKPRRGPIAKRKKLTCAQLANTFQEDADFLGAWYSGWYNGLAKKNAINIPRAKEGIHQVIVYCKANPDKKIIQAIDFVLKQEKKNKE